MDKEEEAKALIDPLYEKLDNGEAFDNYEQGIFDVISWLFEGADKPELSN